MSRTLFSVLFLIGGLSPFFARAEHWSDIYLKSPDNEGYGYFPVSGSEEKIKRAIISTMHGDCHHSEPSGSFRGRIQYVAGTAYKYNVYVTVFDSDPADRYTVSHMDIAFDPATMKAEALKESIRCNLNH